MKTNKLILLCGAFTGLIASSAATGHAASQAPVSSEASSITWTAGGKQKVKKVDLLFVQNAKGVAFKNGKLVLRGVNPLTVCFADRPERMAGHMPTNKFVPMWSQGKDSFLKDPPNATLSIFDGDKVVDAVVVLRNPQISGNDLSYEVRVLQGILPAKGGACSLFIDIIGCPLTPFSYAGAARRAYRYAPYGAYYHPPVYGPTVVHYGPYGTTVIRRW